MLKSIFSTLLSILIVTNIALTDENATNSSNNLLSDVPVVEFPSAEKVSFELYNGTL
jgi:hypothetical protein